MGKKLSLTIVAALVILGSSLPAMACDEGLTPGFWKNHTEVWSCLCGVPFSCVFGEPYDGAPNATLLDALRANGGGRNALARHATAAFLNAIYLNYPLCPGEVTSWVQGVLCRDDPLEIECVKNTLDCWNNLGAAF